MTDEEAEAAARRADELAHEIVRLMKQADGQFRPGGGIESDVLRRYKAFERFSIAVSRIREAVRRKPQYAAKPASPTPERHPRI